MQPVECAGPANRESVLLVFVDEAVDEWDQCFACARKHKRAG